MVDEINLNHRYWCFGFDQYYPCGGFADIHKTTDSREEAINWYEEEKSHLDYCEVWDSVTREYLDNETKEEERNG
ncbi:TPA: hypothetical protein ACQ75Q_001431 [Bacillus thuringiensis]|uniref:Uncharacterized protein n=1 Tax=Bacillus cereus TaxID=1396 RepID=A0A9X0MEV3_BACCE|nr:hypothetical protein [Bacillus cereus]MED2035543.1 hypothetical protein [Bacillus thuringiensis]KXY35767.1 hypothetical protein AT268_03735 [Bacillus cereus]PEE34637.1 hypothetical protein CON59_19680 [Bacillus cereus]PET39213.1 hypothetical protein CN523_25270 [Bacillus cereus]PEV71999.1 hypothetical protein CN429_29945 [Bacillus cereus]